jgi:imidazolonepropionase-like amidohydrolase
MATLDHAKRAADPRLAYLPATFRTFWDPHNDFRFKTLTASDFALGRKVFRRELALVGAMRAAGVELLAGTDTMNPYCFPGFGLHEELVWLVRAGLTPLEALQAATRNPARFLGRERDLGTVEPGKLADLVLLDADPLADIHNTRTIRAVVLGGMLLDRAALDRLLADARAMARAVPADEAP